MRHATLAVTALLALVWLMPTPTEARVMEPYVAPTVSSTSSSSSSIPARCLPKKSTTKKKSKRKSSGSNSSR